MALRSFRRDKLTTAVNVLSLALGLACFVAAYSISRDFASTARYANAERTYVVTQSITEQGETLSGPLTGASVAEHLEIDVPELDSVARATYSSTEYAVVSSRSEGYQRVIFADPAYVDIFDLGVLDAGNDNPLREPHSALISERAASAFFGNGSPIGGTLRIAGAVDVTVAGVIPGQPRDHLNVAYDMIVSMDVRAALDARTRLSAGADWAPRDIVTYALLPKDGALTRDDFAARLERFGPKHVPIEMMGGAEVTFSAIPVARFAAAFVDDRILDGRVGLSVTTLILLLGVVVLVTACVNYANLAAARAVWRAKQSALRKVLGAGRRELMLQMLIEGALLTALALIVVLAGIKLAIPPINYRFQLALDLPIETNPSWWMLSIALVLGAGAAAGGYPALLVAGVHPIEALRTGPRRGDPRLLPKVLVASQFAVASVLLIVVMAMLAHHRTLERIGFASAEDSIVAIASELPNADSTRDAFATELLEHPSIVSVSATDLPPWTLDELDNMRMTRSTDAGAERVDVLLNQVGHDFFETMQTQLLAGRVFSRDRGDDVASREDLETGNSAPWHAVIDRSLAARFGWQNPRDAVGERVYRDYGDFLHPIEVVGVVEDIPYKLLSYGYGSSFAYFLQPNDASMTLVRVSETDIAGALVHIDRTWEAFAPEVPIRRRFTDELFDRSYALFERFNLIFGGLAAFAILIACIGLFGAAHHAVGRRVREIGVRTVLGAKGSRILRLLLWDFSKPVLLANLIAWPIGFVAMSAYFGFFVHRTALSPWPLVASLGLTLAAAWVAVAGQTVRAVGLRPAAVLRQE